VITIAPSLLACDFSRIAEETARAEAAGADELHVDVKDGHYVSNITIGPVIVEAVRRSTKLPLNVHLMIDNPELYAADFVDAGARCLLVHPEAKGDPAGALRTAREKGAMTGIALNPETPVESARPFLGDIEFLLVMSVNPGWGGQAFMPEVLVKFGEAREHVRPETRLGIDGGINMETARDAVEVGCNYLIAGTFLFRAEDMADRIARLRRLADGS